MSGCRNALEVADDRLKAGTVDVGDLEKMLGAMLATQLLRAVKLAKGEITDPTTRNFH